MSDLDKMKKRARQAAKEQFEFCDFEDYGKGEFVEEIADMLVEFATQELQRAAPLAEAYTANSELALEVAHESSRGTPAKED